MFRKVYIFSLILQLSLTAYAQKPTPADFQIGNLEGLTGRIAFTVEQKTSRSIFLLDIDLKRVTPLIEGPGENWYPSWSPDGTALAFTSDRDGNPEIYVSLFDGTEQQRITQNETPDDNATWWPSGSKVVYYSTTGKQKRNPTTNLFSFDLNTLKKKQITDFQSGKNSTPRVSPDARHISYSTNRFWPGWDVCIWDLQKQKERCVLSGTKSFCRAEWSPAGNLLTYSYGAFSQIDIFFLETKSGDKVRVSALPGKEYDATWSPDGKAIAYAAEEENGNYNIYIDRQFESKPLLKSKHSLRYLSWSAQKTFDVEAERQKKFSAL